MSSTNRNPKELKELIEKTKTRAIEWKKDKEKYLGGKKDDITCVVAQVKLHR